MMKKKLDSADSSSKKRQWRPLIIIVILSLVAHLTVFFLTTYKKPVLADEVHYHSMALSIIRDLKIPGFGPPVNIRTPGYSIFLVPFYLLYPSPLVARILNICLSLFAIYLTYNLAGIYIGRAGAIISSVLVGFHPAILIFSPLVIVEPLAMVLVLLLQIFLVRRLSDKSSNYVFIITGLFIGYTALVKPNMLLLLVILGIYIFFRYGFRHSLIPLILTGLFTIMVIAPWTVRNYIKYDGLIPLSSNAGYLFWASNNEDLIKIGREGKYYEYRLTEEWSEIKDLSILERDKECWKRGFEFYREDPKRGAIFVFKKAFVFIDPLSIGEDYYRWGKIKISYNFLRICNYIFVFSLIVFFISGLVSLKNKRGFFILITPIIVLFISGIIWWSSYRFRMICEPSIMIIVASGVVYTARSIREFVIKY